jgi:hypothetical protein
MSVAVGDVNGDGKADIALGATGEDVGINTDQGRAYVFSGATGSLLFTLDIPMTEAFAHFGLSLAVADVNGDAKGDIAVGTPYEDVGGNQDQGQAYVFSGANGSLLFTWDNPMPQWTGQFGYSVAVGDVNGDGRGDIAVGARSEDVVGGIADQGQAYVFSGADGSLLFTLDIPNPEAGAFFGHSVAVGDVNGDGKGEIAVGAFGEDVGGNADQGRAYVFSASVATPTPTDTPTATPTAIPTDIPTATPTDTPTPSIVCGDVTGDGRVTLADVAAETLALLRASQNPRYDVNHDGKVNLIDLAIVVRQLGRRC